MSQMFSRAHSFNQNIGGWNVSKVPNMSNMFMCACEFNQNIGGWNVSKVNNMDLMFYGARKFKPDQIIKEWNNDYRKMLETTSPTTFFCKC